jgi:hypothetical protein
MPKIWGTDLIIDIVIRTLVGDPITDASVYIAECYKSNEATTNRDHGIIYFNGKTDKNGRIEFNYTYRGDVPVIVRVRAPQLDFMYEQFTTLSPKGIVLPLEPDSGYPY